MKKIRILPWILALLFMIGAYKCEEQYNAEKERRAVERETNTEPDSLSTEHKKSLTK